jgi:hypothetical protein
MHQYTKIILPSLREDWFVKRHRRRGHSVVHNTETAAYRCYWECSCKALFRC